MGVPEGVAGTTLKFGRWTVLRTNARRCADRSVMDECLCECGTVRTVRRRSLQTGVSVSCGCSVPDATRAFHTKHGQSRTRLYGIWHSMKVRCDSNHPRYGGRGIRVCERWRESFENFALDMGPRPPGATLERKDNDGDYEPSNCRWATWAEQGVNRRNTAFLIVDGVKRSLADCAREYGIKRNVLDMRIKAGWETERALSFPVRKMRKL
jgi:hypothetical protein